MDTDVRPTHPDNAWQEIDECPWCGGTVEWLSVDPADPDVGPEEVLVCYQCGEIARQLQDLQFDHDEVH